MRPLIPGIVTQLQKRVTSFTYFLSRDIALQIIKKERCLLSIALFSCCKCLLFNNSIVYHSNSPISC